jgi:hypothetical protein
MGAPLLCGGGPPCTLGRLASVPPAAKGLRPQSVGTARCARSGPAWRLAISLFHFYQCGNDVRKAPPLLPQLKEKAGVLIMVIVHCKKIKKPRPTALNQQPCYFIQKLFFDAYDLSLRNPQTVRQPDCLR